MALRSRPVSLTPEIRARRVVPSRGELSPDLCEPSSPRRSGRSRAVHEDELDRDRRLIVAMAVSRSSPPAARRPRGRSSRWPVCVALHSTLDIPVGFPVSNEQERRLGGHRATLAARAQREARPCRHRGHPPCAFTYAVKNSWQSMPLAPIASVLTSISTCVGKTSTPTARRVMTASSV
jgi:hypothetical protein